MDKLMNRSRTFAEAVVTMVSLVLPTAALEGKNMTKGLDVPKFALILAIPTIISGICPLLACCILDNQHAISDVAAFLSAGILLCLACWIATFTAWVEFWSTAGALILCCMGLRTISYFMEKKKVENEAQRQNPPSPPPPHPSNEFQSEGDHEGEHGLPVRTDEFHTILDGSHEFLCCMTGIHFLWLESLALEALIGKTHGIQNDLSDVMGSVNIICCAISLFILLLEMTPPLTFVRMDQIAGPLFWFDTFMIITIATVVGVALWKSLVLPGLLPRILGTSIIIVGLVLIAFKYVCCPKKTGSKGNEEPPKLAPLGLTKLMVTGFLAVYISVDSTHRSITYWFLAFAAAAILSGLIWRLLTQYHLRKVLENNQILHSQTLLELSARTQDRLRQARIVETAALASSANAACFCTHTFVAIAAFLLMIEIYTVK